MSTQIQDFSRKKEKQFVEQANRPVQVAKLVLRATAGFVGFITIVTLIFAYGG